MQNRAGQKFPTGFPSRRAWLQVTVTDAGGKTLFSSGATDKAGRLVDSATGRLLPSEIAGGPVQPHRTKVTAADQVQVYPSVMQDSAGKPTFALLRGAAYAEDSRLLPKGWDKKYSNIKEIKDVGTVSVTDFVGGEDKVAFALTLKEATAPLTVKVRLMCQTLSARFAAELFRHNTAPIAWFRRYYQAAAHPPEEVDSASVTVK